MSRDDRPQPGETIKPKKPARVQFTSMVLQLEAFVVLFAGMALHGLQGTGFGLGVLRLASVVPMWIFTGLLCVVLLVLSRTMGRPGSYMAGSVVQVPVLAMGLLLPMMFFVGAVFVTLWVVSLRLGARIDRERAEYDEEHPETAPNLDA